MSAVRPMPGNRTVCEKPDFKPCGTGDSNHEVCVLSSNDCPIDRIMITNEPVDDIDWKSAELDFGYRIYFTPNSSSLPLVDFTLTEGQVCIFPDEFDRPEDKQIYPLLRTWKNSGCERSIGNMTHDDRWIKVANRTEAQLIDENPNIKARIANLPEFQATGSPFFMYTMPYVDWKLECQYSDMAKMNRIAEDNNPVNTLANVQLFYMIISFLSLLIIGIISPGFVIYKQVLNIIGKTEADKDLIASNGMRLIAGIFIILKGSFLISAIVIIKSFTNMVDYIEEHNCTDETTTAIFVFLRGVLLDANSQNIYGIITVGIMGGFELLGVLAMWCWVAIS